MRELSCDYCAADFMEGEACFKTCRCVDCDLKADDAAPDTDAAPFAVEVTPAEFDSLIGNSDSR